MTGYDGPILQAFLTAHGERRADGKLVALNGRKLSESNREMVARWAELERVDLSKVDRFLQRHDLWTLELEVWAYEHHGWEGYVAQ